MDSASLAPLAGHGGHRDAPMLLIGEGTSEIQKMIIGQRLVRDYRA